MWYSNFTLVLPDRVIQGGSILIENGVIRNYYVDTYYGRKLEMAPTTGSATKAQTVSGPSSTIRVSN